MKKAMILMVPFILLACSCKTESPANGWREKVNNNLIGRITLGTTGNCAAGQGRHVVCTVTEEDVRCWASVSYTDGSPSRGWELENCLGQYLIYDDGNFSYFYGFAPP